MRSPAKSGATSACRHQSEGRCSALWPGNARWPRNWRKPANDKSPPGLGRATGFFFAASGGWARTVPVSASNAAQPSQTNLQWNPGSFICPRQRRRVKGIYGTSPQNRPRQQKRVPRGEEKACHPDAPLSRIAVPDTRRTIHEHKESCQKNRCEPVLHARAHDPDLSVAAQRTFRQGCAPQLRPPGTRTRALAASVNADNKQMRMNMGQCRSPSR